MSFSAGEPASFAGEALNSPLSDYSRKLSEGKVEIQQIESARLHALIVIVGCLLLFLVAMILAWRQPLVLVVMVPAGAVGARSFRRYKDCGDRWKQLALRCDCFERGIARLTDRWQGTGRTGAEFIRKGHLYQEDLNVLGEGSLFELLCTTRTEAGASRLASYLLDPVPLQESIQRQEAVKELRDAERLREEVEALGDYRSQDLSGNAFRAWLDLPVFPVSKTGRAMLFALSCASLILGICILIRIVLWTHWLPLLVLLLLIQIIWSGILARRVHPRLQRLSLLTGALTVLRQGLALLEQERFESAKLRDIVDKLRGHHASAVVHRLEKMARGLDQREKPEFYLLARLLAAGIQLVLASERWRTAHGKNLDTWLGAWAEFEALHCLAGYAHEHPGNIFPSFVEEGPSFEAKELGHPLLAAEGCVGNDVALGKDSRLYIVSGANMAGKSTLMRAIGLNVVLALAGAPVRAVSACFSDLTVCASIALTDSLTDGKSKFLAEVERIREMISLARSRGKLLFLIDEILSGTNSYDRKVSTEMIVKTLLASDSIGVLSTHDLALTEIAADPMLAAVLVHMGSRSVEAPLDFDYRLPPGVSRETNALAIVKMMGITPELSEK